MDSFCFFSSRRRHTRFKCDWSSDVCSSDLELMAEAGMVGYLPRPAEPFVFSFRNFPSCKMLTDIFHVMGIFMGGRQNQCLGSLAAGQLDKHGNINSTILPGVTAIP